MSSPDHEFDVPSCRICACTEDDPCLGGCEWVFDPGAGDLCSTCLEAVHDALGRHLQGRAEPGDLELLRAWAQVPQPTAAPAAAIDARAVA